LSNQLTIRINPDAVIGRHEIDGERFALVADDFLLNTDEIIEFARSHYAEFEMPERSYPGQVFDVPDEAVSPLHRFWRSRLSREFSFARSDIMDYCLLSVTTLQPEQFSWIQRLPHTDPRSQDGRHNYALLVYLFDDPDLGGTGFYRYRDEKFWHSMVRRQLDDPAGGQSLVQARYPMFREPAKYPSESDEAVELLSLVPARFNRMVCYSGDIPHSAYIKDASVLADDCVNGRLTLNAFAAVWPKHP
jgi:hypothetical protein